MREGFQVILQRRMNTDLYDMFVFEYVSGRRLRMWVGADEIEEIDEGEQLRPCLTLPGPVYGLFKEQMAQLVGPSTDAAATIVLREWLEDERAQTKRSRESNEALVLAAVRKAIG